MTSGTRSDDDAAAPGDGHVGAPSAEPVVDGVAVELPGYEQPVPESIPFPGADEPGPSFWQEPVLQLADERPELVVAAAFAGGLLTAMILRRLGS